MFRSSIVQTLFNALFLSLICPILTSVAEDGTIVKPVITVDEMSHSFGTVAQGTVIKHDFIVKNAGAAELVVHRLVAACGCTAALPPSGPIPPGQSAPITVTFDSSGFEGGVEKTVRVFSSDTESPAPLLTLRGTVETPLLIDPVRINFGEVSKGTPVAPKSFKITVKNNAKGALKSVTSYSQDVSIAIKKSSDTAIEGEVTLLEGVKTGDFRDRLLIDFASATGSRQFNIPVVAMVKGAVELSPRTLSVGVIEGTQSIVRAARLINRSKTPIEIISASADNPAVTVEAKTMKPGKEFSISVSVDPTKIHTDLRTSVKIETNSKEQGTVILNVYGILPPKR